MGFSTSKIVFKKTFSCLGFLSLAFISFSQQIDSSKQVSHFSAAVTATNNGISLLPNFSLGKPAVIFNMAIGKRKLSFEPELRFAVEGAKPWSFLFWWRYKVVKTDKFTFNVGAHPAIAFRNKTFVTDGVSENTLVAQRFLAAELSPNYAVNKNVSVGIYYLHAFGFEPDVTQNTDFFAVRSTISNINLSHQFALRFNPQVYFLKMDNKSGVYVSETAVLSRKNCPFSLSSIVSKSIKTDISGKDFVWNLSLTYAFANHYVQH
jgi:hypothetical protein